MEENEEVRRQRSIKVWDLARRWDQGPVDPEKYVQLNIPQSHFKDRRAFHGEKEFLKKNLEEATAALISMPWSIFPGGTLFWFRIHKTLLRIAEAMDDEEPFMREKLGDEIIAILEGRSEQ